MICAPDMSPEYWYDSTITPHSIESTYMNTFCSIVCTSAPAANNTTSFGILLIPAIDDFNVYRMDSRYVYRMVF